MAPVDQALFDIFDWRSIGPHRAGRVTCTLGHPTEQGTFYFGSCGGGVFKTTDGGAHWVNITDGYFKRASSVGAIAMAPSDPNIIYVGTGETSIRSNVVHGDGMYRTLDGGKTWEHLGLEDTRYIGAIAVDPRDPDTVLVAALGHAWGRNEERGVFKTTDGGKSWRKVLYKSDKAGAVKMSMDAQRPHIIFASIWEAQRYPWAASSGGPDSGLWRSADGGETWEDITERLGFKGVLGKIGVAVSPANPERVWALVEAEDGALMRSDDGGETWNRFSEEMGLRTRAWYYTHIFADPSDEDTVWVLNTSCFKSTDGGKNFEVIPTPHGDNHGLWIDPNNSDRMIEGNDGGAAVTYNGGKSWSSPLNQPTGQFYHVTTDNQQPYHVYGSQQDNWAMRLPSVSFEGAISWKDYMEPGGGESGYIAIKPTEPYTVFGGGIGTGLGHGRLRAWNPKTRQSRNVTVWPEVHGFGAGAEELKYRFQWTFPLEFSPHNPDKLYACSNHVHVSFDEGHTWEVASPDLTRDDPEKQASSGGPITSDNSGAEIYCTIFAFKESPHTEGVLWAGSDDGLLHLSKDGGQNWEQINPSEELLPEWSRISMIELSPHTDGKAYVAVNRYQLNDNRPIILKTDDFGQSWTMIVDGIPEDDFVRVVREDPTVPGLLYCGTETGVYVSFDDGASWQGFQANLPVTPIYDLVVKDTDLVVATNGRGFWILDDITPLHQIAGSDGVDQVTLFKPRDTVRWRYNPDYFSSDDRLHWTYKMTGPVTVTTRRVTNHRGEVVTDIVNAGANPPNGVIVPFWLPSVPDEAVKLTFLDSEGRVLRSFSTEAEDEDNKLKVRAGANRFVWNLSTESPAVLDEESGDRRANILMRFVTPRVPPGTYQVRLEAGQQGQTQTFELLHDPRLTVPVEDLEEQFELKSQIRNQISDVHETVNQLRRVRAQVDGWLDRTNIDAVTEAGEAVKTKLGELENQLLLVDESKPKAGSHGVREKLGALAGMIDESDHAPTQAGQEVAAQLNEDTVSLRQQLTRIVDQDVKAFTELLSEHGVPLIAPEKPGPKDD